MHKSCTQIQSVLGGPAVATELSAASNFNVVQLTQEVNKQIPAVVAAPGESMVRQSNACVCCTTWDRHLQ
jgi:hypothetical protein